jgi:hypothetical protein
MLAQVPVLIQDVGAWCLALTAVLTLLALVSRTRAYRWLFTHMVAEPMTHWLRREITETVEPMVAPIRAELTTNGGSTVKDSLLRIEHRQAVGEKRSNQRLERIEAHIGLEQ